ncbi:MAG: trigger factor [Gammaproteobacteria bacterium]|nr:trigger factor [Gammaproteobacteria bacterium]
MQVSVENASGLERRVRVQVPEDSIATEVSARLTRLSKTARVAGFRPGKVPMSVINRKYAAQVRQEVVGEVLRRSFSEAMTQQKLRPVGDPMIDPLMAEPGGGLDYTATFEVVPEVKLQSLADLSLTRETCEITDGDIDKMIETLRKQHREWKEVDRAAAMGDRLTIDLVGRVDGEIFDGGEAKDFAVELGSGSLIAGFEEGLVGAVAGEERKLDLSFPEDYRNTTLAGKAATFDVTVSRIEGPELPALEAEFFSKFGLEQDDLAAFRQEVRENMEREMEQALSRNFKTQVMDKLAQANTLDLPKALVASESHRLLEELKRSMSMQGMDKNQLNGLSPDMMAPQASKRVQLGLLMAEVVRESGLKVNPDKVRTAVEKLASSYQESDQVVRWYYEDPSRLQEIEATTLEDDAIQWVAEQAQVAETSVTFDALMNRGQTSDQGKAEG